MQNNSQIIMADICKEYLKVAKEKKFEFYRLFSGVPFKFYSKYQGKLSKNEIEVLYAAKLLKVKKEVALNFYSHYRTGFYRTDDIENAQNSEEVIFDLKLSQEFREILWQRHKLAVDDLERMLDLENEKMHKKFDERANWKRKENEQAKKADNYQEYKVSNIDVKERIRELKILMHRNHPDKGGDHDLFVKYSKELAEIRGY